MAVSKYLSVHRDQHWLRSENYADSRSTAISYSPHIKQAPPHSQPFYKELSNSNKCLKLKR